MQPVSLADDLIPLAEFKATASQQIKTLKGRSRPLVVTVNGRAAAIVISPEAWDQMQYRERLLADIQAGREDIRAGRSMSTEEMLEYFRQTPETAKD